MRAELFRVQPQLQATEMEGESFYRPLLYMYCMQCGWSFLYPEIALGDLLAHAENHSAEHPSEEGSSDDSEPGRV